MLIHLQALQYLIIISYYNVLHELKYNSLLLFFSLCRNSWGSVSIYSHMSSVPDMTYKRLFLILDEASLTFNTNPFVVS